LLSIALRKEDLKKEDSFGFLFFYPPALDVFLSSIPEKERGQDFLASSQQEIKGGQRRRRRTTSSQRRNKKKAEDDD